MNRPRRRGFLCPLMRLVRFFAVWVGVLVVIFAICFVMSWFGNAGPRVALPVYALLILVGTAFMAKNLM